jgi:predicted transcriptional regulator
MIFFNLMEIDSSWKAYLALAEERHRETLAALRDVDAGRMVEHAEVESWLTRLAGARRGKGHTMATG